MRCYLNFLKFWRRNRNINKRLKYNLIRAYFTTSWHFIVLFCTITVTFHIKDSLQINVKLRKSTHGFKEPTD